MEISNKLKIVMMLVIGVVVLSLVYSELVPDIKSIGSNMSNHDENNTNKVSKLAGLFGTPLQIIIAGMFLAGLIFFVLRHSQLT